MGRAGGYVSILIPDGETGVGIPLRSGSGCPLNNRRPVQRALFAVHNTRRPLALPTRICWRLTGVQPLAVLLYIKTSQGVV